MGAKQVRQYRYTGRLVWVILTPERRVRCRPLRTRNPHDAHRERDALYRIRFHGRGGQGMKTASRILGTAFFLEGFEVQDAPR